jgi:CRP-like cAMP-binding protein
MIGRVEAVTWRTTAIRTNNNTLIILPNSRVARDPLEVFPLNNLNRRVLRFPAPYSIPPERVIALAQEIVHATANIATERTPVARVADFSDSSVTYELLYWSKDYMLVPDTDCKIKERIWYAYHRGGIEIPFPTRHLVIERRGADGKSAPQDYARIIEGVEIFEPLSPREREELSKELVQYVYAPGEVILRRGEPGQSMFVINRGRVEVRLPGANGSLQRVAVLERGGFFGEMGLFTGEPRTADVSALEEVEIVEIRKSALESLLSQNAGLAEAFSHKIAERQAELAQYSVNASEMNERLKSETILRRIKRFFSLN